MAKDKGDKVTVEIPFFRSAYNYDRDAASRETAVDCQKVDPETGEILEPSKTQQQFRDEVDINTIVERFGLTGELPEQFAPPSVQDFTGIFDFQTAMNAVVEARDKFMQMPAKLRARFHNDPQELMAFLDDEENRPEAEKLGLAVKREILPVQEASAPAPARGAVGQARGVPPPVSKSSIGDSGDSADTSVKSKS